MIRANVNNQPQYPLPDSDAALLREALAEAWPLAGAATPPGAGAAALAVALARDVSTPCVLAVASDPAALVSFAADAAALLSPGDCLRTYPMSGDGGAAHSSVAARSSALTALSALGDRKAARRAANLLVCSCPGAMAQPAPDPALAESLSLRFVSGEPPQAPEADDGQPPPNGPDGAGLWLAARGYRRAPEVFEPGTWAARGGVLDVWPAAAIVPSRIEFFDDVVESVRTFDPATQRSDREIGTLRVPPAKLPENKTRLLADFLPRGVVVVWLDAASAADQRCSTLRGSAVKQIFLGLPVPDGVREARLPFAAPDTPGAQNDGGDGWSDPDVAAARRRAIIARAADAARAGTRVRAWVDSESAAARLNSIFAAVPGAQICVRPISGGFAIVGPNGTAKTVWLAQSDLFGRSRRVVRDAPSEADGSATVASELAMALDALPPTVSAPTAASAASASASGQDPAEALAARILESVTPGDLVVHEDHGIGRYLGMERIEIAGRAQDTLVIEYAEGTRLHVPLDKAHLVSRYTGAEDERSVKLHAIGSKRWASERRAAADSVRRLAAGMLRRQAMRREMPGRPFSPDTPYLAEFEASFPYVETPGQAECIRRVYEDMQSPHPMDRLVCGDAGYGKTEIALRAAFVCAMQGRQVAVLVPTTVLAQQHYDLFRDRFAPYPVKIALHSAFASAVSRREAEKGAADGTVDILVGTHGIIGDKVKFKNLGLVIVDEEQRFGVRHKEKLKEESAMVDVLTLSATPIPRSLYLGLVGARDLSLLRTPPPGRVAIRTRVAAMSEKIVREAVERELSRGGQIFYLHNRVSTLPVVASKLRRMFPSLRVAIGHGQLPASETAAVMRDFAAGRFDVLLSTTIVENGIDVPRANTIIVDRADRFGIADLYQLRGRVGRSREQAWAYFLVPDSDTLSSDARKRLEALEGASDLGCGVSLAMRDLSIRGAGNLLGAEQSGHIAAVGFRLYCQLLRRAVARLRGEEPPLLVDTELALPFLSSSPEPVDGAAAAFLPREYAGDDSARIEFHRRIAECSSEAELDALRAETTDRFGAPPPELSRLYEAARLRILAAERGISRVRVDPENGRLFLYRDGTPLRFRGALPVPAGDTPDERLASVMRLVRIQSKVATVAKQVSWA